MRRRNESSSPVPVLRPSLVALALLAALAARPTFAQSCIGDCGGDGTVTIDDLMVGIAAVLAGNAPDCVAWDPDGDFRVQIGDLVRGVARALAGPCWPTATPTFTPTVPADPLLALIQPVWVDACRLLGVLYGESSATADAVTLFCIVSPGHDNHTVLRRYGSTDEAASELAARSAGFDPASLRQLPAAYKEEPFYTGLGGAYRTLVWQLDCWVATVASFDDTSYRFAPDPFAFSAALLDVAGTALRERCAPQSTPTATPTVTPTPDPLFASLVAPWDAACRPFGLGAGAGDGLRAACAD